MIKFGIGDGSDVGVGGDGGDVGDRGDVGDGDGGGDNIDGGDGGDGGNDEDGDTSYESDDINDEDNIYDAENDISDNEQTRITRGANAGVRSVPNQIYYRERRALQRFENPDYLSAAIPLYEFSEDINNPIVKKFSIGRMNEICTNCGAYNFSGKIDKRL